MQFQYIIAYHPLPGAVGVTVYEKLSILFETFVRLVSLMRILLDPARD